MRRLRLFRRGKNDRYSKRELFSMRRVSAVFVKKTVAFCGCIFGWLAVSTIVGWILYKFNGQLGLPEDDVFLISLLSGGVFAVFMVWLSQ